MGLDVAHGPLGDRAGSRTFSRSVRITYADQPAGVPLPAEPQAPTSQARRLATPGGTPSEPRESL